MNLHFKTAPSESRARAASSSFYLAMRLMPAAQRRAMFEVYSFCREVDDIADEGGAKEVQLERLDQWRADIEALYADTEPAAHLRPLADAIRDFKLRREDFLAVIDGMRMDVTTVPFVMGWAKLDLYCDCVASAVGRLGVRIFGMQEAAGIELAHHLGRALQLTNVLRDLDDDAAIGRLYLPLEALRVAGVMTTEPNDALANPAIGDACALVVARAQDHFRQSDAIIARCPGRVVRTPRIMSAGYRMILESLIARGWRAPRARVKLRRSLLLWSVVRSALQ
jgi:presqualene diphosphate synthase